MGFFNELLNVVKSSTKTLKGYPGPSQVAQVEGFDGAVYEVEVFGSPGIASAPSKNTKLILVPIAGSKEYAVAVGSTNYALGESLNQGETLLYSFNSSGASLAAKIKTEPNGKITIESMLGGDVTVKTAGKVKFQSAEEINFMGNAESLVIYGPLNTALQSLVESINTALAGKLGAPATVSLDISSAEADKLKTG